MRSPRVLYSTTNSLNFGGRITLQRIVRGLQRYVEYLVHNPTGVLSSRAHINVGGHLTIFVLGTVHHISRGSRKGFRPLNAVSHRSIRNVTNGLHKDLTGVLVTFLRTFSGPGRLVGSFGTTFFVTVHSFVRNVRVNLPLLSP